MGSPMDSVDTKRMRRNRFVSPRFRLEVFERKLRSVLGADASRLPGEPGSDSRPIRSCPRRAVVDYLIDSLMSKYDDGPTSKTAKFDKAIQKFLEAEEVCFFRNLFFSQEHNWISKTYPELGEAQRLCYELFAEEIDLDRIARGFGWGPGASTRLTRRAGDPCYKYSGHPECTPNAYDLGSASISHNPAWKRAAPLGVEPQVVWGSRITTVAKNYKADRTIAIEPDLNMYLQKGIGAYLRQRLRKVGINLDSQKANQDGARDPTLATVDFSMASDSVSQGLVWYMCPPALRDLIAMTRSELTVMPDKSLLRLNKVSSMGNGFTFELETGLFYCLAAACVPEEQRNRVLVYGDDVLLPVEYADRFLEVAKVAGFTPNTEKTFTSGPFRESCGIHIHSGHDITPFYIRRPVDTLTELFLLHNNLKRWLVRVDPLLTKDQYSGIQSILRDLRMLAPAKWRRARLPDGYGDGAFIGSFAECCPRPHKGGWEYFEIYILAEQAEVVETEVPGLLVKSLTNLHKRRKILPEIEEPTFKALPSSGGRVRLSRIVVPWSAFG